MNTETSPFKMMADMNKQFRARTGRSVGIAVEKGLFVATVSERVGRKEVTTELTPMQTWRECFDFLSEYTRAQ